MVRENIGDVILNGRKLNDINMTKKNDRSNVNIESDGNVEVRFAPLFVFACLYFILFLVPLLYHFVFLSTPLHVPLIYASLSATLILCLSNEA